LDDDLWDGVRQIELRFFALRPEIVGRSDGRAIAILDGWNGRIMGLTHVSEGPRHTAGPAEITTGFRHGGHDYPGIASTKNKSIIANPFDIPRIADGEDIRQFGIQPPRVKPNVIASWSEGTEQDINQGVPNWVTAQSGLVTIDNVSGDPQYDNTANHATIILNRETANGNLAFANSAITISSTRNRVQMGIRNKSLTETIPAGSLALVSADDPNLAGTTHTMLIDVDLPPGRWTQVGFTWPSAGTTFTQGSIGLVLLKSLPAGVYGDTGEVGIGVSRIEAVIVTAGELVGRVQVAFSWYDSERNRESDISPISNILELDTIATEVRVDIAGAVSGQEGGVPGFSIPVRVGAGSGNLFHDSTDNPTRIASHVPSQEIVCTATSGGPNANFSVVGDVSGSFGTAVSGTLFHSSNHEIELFITDGGGAWVSGDTITFDINGGVFISNARPDPTIDRVRVYIHKPEFGQDEFGRLVLRLWSEEPIPGARLRGTYNDGGFQVQGEAPIFFNTQKTLDEIIVSNQWLYNHGMPPSTSQVIALADRVFMAGQPDYGVGQVTNTNGLHLVEPVPVVGSISAEAASPLNTGDGTISAASVTSAAISAVWLLTCTVAGPTGTFTVFTGDEISHANVTSASAYTDAGVSFTLGDGATAWAVGDQIALEVRSQADRTPQWGVWMEGRQFSIPSEDRTYLIVKVLDQDDDGIFDAMWVGNGLNFAVPYQGTTEGTGEDYVAKGINDRVWFSTVTATQGIDIESFPVINFRPIEMGEDRITTLGKVGSSLAVLGTENVFVIVPNRGALDDALQTGQPLPRPIPLYGAPGTNSPRTFTPVAGGSALYLDSDGNVGRISSQGAVIDPISIQTQGFISSANKVAQEHLPFAHAAFDKRNNWWVVFLIQSMVSAGISQAIQVLLGGDDLTTVLCDLPGSIRDSRPPISRINLRDKVEFNRVLILDLRLGIPILGAAFPQTTTLRVVPECSPARVNPPTIFAGDALGYVDKMFTPDSFGQGPPFSKVIWGVTAGGASTATLDVTDGGLPTSGNPMKDLVVLLSHADRTLTFPNEFRFIASNTVNQVTVTDIWVTNPVSGDRLFIAPMGWFMEFPELRTQLLHSLNHLVINAGWSTPDTPEVTLEVLAAEGNQISVPEEDPFTAALGRSSPLATRTEINLDELFEAKGKYEVPAEETRASSIRVSGFVPGLGTMNLGPFRALEFVDEEDIPHLASLGAVVKSR
jgi:hypothetical protein